MMAAQLADPRPAQTVFLAPVLGFVLVVALVQPGQLVQPALLGGLLLVAFATVAALLVPWSRLPAGAIAAVPLVDLAGIGVVRLMPDSSVVGSLVVLPAIWLGLVLGRRGVVLVTAASVLLLTIPGLSYYGTGVDGWSRAVVLPIIAFVTAVSVHLTAEVWHDHRTRLEQQGAELERLLREVTQHRQITETIVRTVDVGLLALGRDGAYNSMNPRHREFLRLAYPDGHGGMAGETGYAYAEDAVTELVRDETPSVRAARGEAFSDLTIWVGKEPTTRRALSVSARPMFDEHGDFDGAVLAYKDVTDLMRALSVKDEFVASVSHELRTPLTSILGYVDLIRDHAEELPEPVNHYLEVTHRNAERLLRLVTDLLSTAQTEAGTLRMAREPIDLTALAHQCLASFRARATAADVTIDAAISPVSSIDADPTRITQVLENLLSNALKYTPAGGSVTVSLVEEGSQPVLCVRDTGIGMSPSDRAQLFTKFFRARTAEERAIPGVGLGLVVCKAIVDAHDGTIEVDSTEGEGTTVRVTLPRAQA